MSHHLLQAWVMDTNFAQLQYRNISNISILKNISKHLHTVIIIESLIKNPWGLPKQLRWCGENMGIHRALDLAARTGRNVIQVDEHSDRASAFNRRCAQHHSTPRQFSLAANTLLPTETSIMVFFKELAWCIPGTASNPDRCWVSTISRKHSLEFVLWFVFQA